MTWENASFPSNLTDANARRLKLLRNPPVPRGSVWQSLLATLPLAPDFLHKMPDYYQILFHDSNNHATCYLSGPWYILFLQALFIYLLPCQIPTF